jgi:hypothetical protein
MIKNIADSDLLATDIQRGRDVGIPPYIKVRELCGFSVITSFDDLLKILSPTVSLKIDEYLCLIYKIFLFYTICISLKDISEYLKN